MTNFQLPYFGNIKLNSIEKYYCKNINTGDKEFEIDINFSKTSTTEFLMTIVEKFIKNIDRINQLNINHYKRNFETKGETVDYINYYLEELFEDELSSLIDTSKNLDSQKNQLLQKLELKRVGLYPDQHNEIGYFGVFDYSIRVGGTFCNQLLVLKTNAKGELDHITWES